MNPTLMSESSRRLVTIFVGVLLCLTGLAQTTFRFQFGAGPASPGWITIEPSSTYSTETGFGFEGLEQASSGANFVSSFDPFYFSVRLPEGNYAVTATFGSDTTASTNTVKAELRRLMLERVAVAAGQSATRTFIVNVRTPAIVTGGTVRLKARERENEMVNWDERLTLEFNGVNPAVRRLEIVPTNLPTIFLTGDSTVCDQPREPWNSWGQMLPRFFKPTIAVANHAQSGESIKSSLGAKRFDKVFSQIKSNDWLLLQFGHNDMKDRATNALEVYQANLVKLVQQTREHGATPVLVTSMERKAGLRNDTLAGYPDSVRAVAKSEDVALIDLHAMSKVLYGALGTNLDLAFQDGTHHNNYGSYELARCVVTGIHGSGPGLAAHLAPGAERFNPAQPDDPLQFQMASSPTRSETQPDGN